MTRSRAAADAALPSDRRAFLGSSLALASAVAATALPAAAEPVGADAALLAHRPAWLRTNAALEVALSWQSEIEDQVFSREPTVGDYKDWQGSYVDYRAVVDAKIAAQERIKQELNADACERQVEEAHTACAVVFEAICETRARTLAGLLFKVEVSAERTHSEPDIARSIMDDILAMGGQADVA